MRVTELYICLPTLHFPEINNVGFLALEVEMMDDTIALDSIQAIAASFGSSFDAEKITDTVVEKDGSNVKAFYRYQLWLFLLKTSRFYSPTISKKIVFK